MEQGNTTKPVNGSSVVVEYWLRDSDIAQVTTATKGGA